VRDDLQPAGEVVGSGGGAHRGRHAGGRKAGYRADRAVRAVRVEDPLGDDVGVVGVEMAVGGDIVQGVDGVVGGDADTGRRLAARMQARRMTTA
jgi:hypothetical protein